MNLDADQTMFEIYRDQTYGSSFRVVYYTELGEHDRDKEINRAMAGEHVYSGFLRSFNKAEAKRAIDGILKRLNAGESIESEEIGRELAPYGMQEA